MGVAELLPEMRTGLAGWGGMEGLSPDGPPDPSLLGKGCLELQQQTAEHSSPLESCLALGMPLTVVSLPRGRAGLSQGTDKPQGPAPQGQAGSLPWPTRPQTWLTTGRQARKNQV